MRRPRMTIQNMMVAMVFLAILLWAGPVVVPELARRWTACRDAAARHAAEAAWVKANLAKPWPNAINSAWKAKLTSAWERDLVYHTRMSREYRQALYLPWRFYSLGGTL
jgi:type II secretory pathway component PulJ